MKITITVEELFGKGLWMDFCKLTGVSEWAVNEGRMRSSEEVTLSHNHAAQLGLIPGGPSGGSTVFCSVCGRPASHRVDEMCLDCRRNKLLNDKTEIDRELKEIFNQQLNEI